MNPASKVPVLEVGSGNDAAKIPESHVIMELVADLFPGKLLPQDAIKRAEARYFIERFNQVISTPFYANILRGEESSAKCILLGVKEMQQLLAKYPGDYALGNEISMADIGVWPFVARIWACGKAGQLRILGCRVEPALTVVSLHAPSSGMLVGGLWEMLSTDDEYKVFKAYAEKLFARPAHEVRKGEDSPITPL